MKKTTSFIIKGGRRKPGILGFRLIFKKEISFTYKISRAALYDYNMVVNCWHRIIGLSTFSPLNSSCQLAFINNGYGLQCGFVCWHNGKRTVIPVTHIVPGKAYHISIVHGHREYTIIHTTEEGIVNKHIAPARRSFLWHIMLLPHLGGSFTLDFNLVVTLIK